MDGKPYRYEAELAARAALALAGGAGSIARFAARLEERLRAEHLHYLLLLEAHYTPAEALAELEARQAQRERVQRREHEEQNRQDRRYL
jgi:DNA transposition AAA+ family ATPase